MEQAKEALEIFERLGDAMKQAGCLVDLARALYDDKQLDASETAALRGIQLLPENGKPFRVCQGHRLGDIYSSKDDTEGAAHHFEVALGIATSLDFPSELFWTHSSLAGVFFKVSQFDAAHGHIECARSHTAWAARCSHRLDFGSNKACSKKQTSRPRAPSMLIGRSGLQRKLSSVGSSSGISMDWTLMVSFSGLRHFLPLVTFHFKVRKPNERTEGCIHAHVQVTDYLLSSHPPPTVSLKIASSLHRLYSHTFHLSMSIVLPLMSYDPKHSVMCIEASVVLHWRGSSRLAASNRKHLITTDVTKV